jgi:CBASS immunity sensor of nucleotide second messenger signals/HNH endonuclease
MLWGRSAGRCQKCNMSVSWHLKTMEAANLAEAAHIIGFSEKGPRSESDIPEELLNDASNLMLLCRLCHTPIVDAKGGEYTVEHLRKMKQAHEERVARVTAIGQDRESHILLYGANVGDHHAQLSYRVTAPALLADNRWPASTTPLLLGMINSSFRDRCQRFWQMEADHLRTMVEQHVYPRLRTGSVPHLSIFAFAPQPLLILLGYLLCDINYEAQVYQLHREPPDWVWQHHPDGFQYQIERPRSSSGTPCLVLSLSDNIKNRRIFDTVGTQASVWHVTVPQPNTDFLRSAQQLQQFRELIRPLLNEIKYHYPSDTMLNVFPAAPVSICVELGRAIQPKAHMPMRLWDQNTNLGGFVHALDINALVNEGEK